MRVFFFILAVLFTSCSNETIVSSRFDNVDGLGMKSQVVINGWEVGQIDNIGIDGHSNIVVTIRINEDIKIPKDSEMTLISTDFFGTKAVEINIGESKSLVDSGDTLLSFVKADLIENTIESIGSNAVLSLEDFKLTQDSILSQLKLLNQKLNEKE